MIQNGDYWQQHYLSAERPWSGAAAPGTGPISPRGIVFSWFVVPSLNVQTGPSLAYSVLTVLPRGAEVTVEGWTPGWVRISTSAGAVGWVMREGVAGNLVYGRRATVIFLLLASAGMPGPAPRPFMSQACEFTVLHHCSLPSSSLWYGVTESVSPVVTANLKDVTARGVIGWAMAQYIGRSYVARSTISRPRTVGHTALRYGVNVRALPSLSAAVAYQSATVFPYTHSSGLRSGCGCDSQAGR